MPATPENAQGIALARLLADPLARLPAEGAVLAVRSPSGTGLQAFPPERITCLQTDRRHAMALEQAGLRVVTEASGPFAWAIVEATRDREENLYHLALAWSLLAPTGTLVLSAANALGGETLVKRLKETGLPIERVFSKAKCRVIALSRADAGDTTLPPEWLALGEWREIPDTGLVTAPGMFSAHAIDAGSQRLCAALDRPLTGHGADFGAGYGALSRHVLEHSDGISSLDLYEVEWKALAAAERNLAPWRAQVSLRFLWQDLTQSRPTGRYDWIVMNPPFHAGTATTPALGQCFIAAAAGALHGRGVLWMVANRHLPYERLLRTHFRQVSELGGDAAYKVLRAAEPLAPPPRAARRKRRDALTGYRSDT